MFVSIHIAVYMDIVGLMIEPVVFNQLLPQDACMPFVFMTDFIAIFYYYAVCLFMRKLHRNFGNK